MTFGVAASGVLKNHENDVEFEGNDIL